MANVSPTKNQHTKPCKECPFRRSSPRGYLGGNHPQEFAVLAGHDGFLPCHMTMGKKTAEKHCAGRAIMFANSCKSSRDGSVINLPKDNDNVFSHIAQFNEHHHITLTPGQFMGLEPLNYAKDGE